MGSGAVIYVPSFIKIGSGNQKLIGGDTQQTRWSHTPILFFQNKESRLKRHIIPPHIYYVYEKVKKELQEKNDCSIL
jgi:hypothetical protein